MQTRATKQGTLLWEPSEDLIRHAVITRYMRWLKEQRNLEFNDYQTLWEWSVTRLEDFWQSLWDFFEIKASKRHKDIGG